MILYNYKFGENCVQEAPCIVEITEIKYFKVFLNVCICTHKTPFCKSGQICIKEFVHVFIDPKLNVKVVPCIECEHMYVCINRCTDADTQ